MMRPNFFTWHLYLTLTILCIVGVVSFFPWNGSLEFTAPLSKLKTSYFIRPAHDNTQVKISGTKNETVAESSASWVQALGHGLKNWAYGSLHNHKDCDMDTCVDYSLCSLKSPFSFYLYPDAWLGKASNKTNTLTALFQTFLMNENREKDPKNSCIYVALIDLCHSKQMYFNGKWYQDGKNHIFWTHCSDETITAADFHIPRHSMRAMESFSMEFRPNFDLVVSHWESLPMDFHDIWMNVPQLFPIRRMNRACFTGCNESPLLTYTELQKRSQLLRYKFIKNDQCQNETLRREILQKSIFSVIILPLGTTSGASVSRQIYESLREAAIPVIVGARFSAPFQDVLDWSKVIITVAVGRFNELPGLLDAISDSEIIEFKKQGRLFLEKYVGSLESMVQTFLATLRTRFGLPPRSFGPVDSAHVHDDPHENEASVKAITYIQNYSMNYERKYEAWNEVFQPFKMYPNTPWEQDAHLGSSGRLFKEDFNGSKTARKGSRLELFEKFTIVIQTYRRHKVLVKCLKRLNGMKFLHKVLVVWNELNPPPESFQWPNISAPIVVIFPRRNSLNNRFIPFDEIETEGVFGLDNDMQFSQEQLTYGFHVWTENRDRLVGFMSRWHSWDERKKSWIYHWSSSNCEISIVLAGAAFIHKMYLYKYTYEMPDIIRRTVDMETNCEDLAMNFLIAHVSKKPPIKLTNKDDFRVYGAGGGISSRSGYLRRRHECLNFFYRVYGYMPLRFTVSRADSVMYNTKTKTCFKTV